MKYLMDNSKGCRDAVYNNAQDLFDAECIHGVDKILSNKNRVSISFNISVE